MALFLSFIAGGLFAVGLSLSGMINPQKVRGFLDVFGQWDPALLFVMMGAVVFNFFSFRWLQTRAPWCASSHFLPTKKDLDQKLVAGAALFGMGWAIMGVCPGPAVVNLSKLDPTMVIFVLAMVSGMILARKIERR